MFQWHFIRSSRIIRFGCTVKLKCLLMKPTHDDIIDAKEVYIQKSFRRYKVKLEVLLGSYLHLYCVVEISNFMYWPIVLKR